MQEMENDAKSLWVHKVILRYPKVPKLKCLFTYKRKPNQKPKHVLTDISSI